MMAEVESIVRSQLYATEITRLRPRKAKANAARATKLFGGIRSLQDSGKRGLKIEGGYGPRVDALAPTPL
jgi:hypothetical protein